MNMDIFAYNVSWMTWNLSLAVLPVLFSFFLFRKVNNVFKAAMFVLWFLFLPNTIYVITDLIHLFDDWGYFSTGGKIVLLIQYGIFEIIGLTCFLVAFYPMEKLFTQWGLKGKQFLFGLIGMHFLMGFAMVLGRVERANSWDVFANPVSVLISSFAVLTSLELLGLTILLGLFSNFFYFFFREKAQKLSMKFIS